MRKNSTSLGRIKRVYLSSTIFKDDWPRLEVHQKHRLQLRKEIMKHGRELVQHAVPASWPCSAPPQRFYLLSQPTPEPIPTIAAWYIDASKSKIFEWKPLLVWAQPGFVGVMRRECRICQNRCRHGCKLSQNTSSGTEMKACFHTIKVEHYIIFPIPCWELWCKVECTFPCRDLLRKNCRRRPSSCWERRRE